MEDRLQFVLRLDLEVGDHLDNALRVGRVRSGLTKKMHAAKGRVTPFLLRVTPLRQNSGPAYMYHFSKPNCETTGACYTFAPRVSPLRPRGTAMYPSN